MSARTVERRATPAALLRPMHTPLAPPRGSLRHKVLLVVMLATLGALLLSALALIVYEARSYRSTAVADISSQADLLAQSVAPALVFDDPRAAGQALLALRLRPQIEVAAVYDARREVFASYRVNADPATQPPPRPGASGPRFDGAVLELFVPIRSNGEPVGTLYLRARHDLYDRIGDYLAILVLTTAAGLALAALIFRQMHPSITGPILSMAEVSRRVSEERNYNLRVTATSDDEVGVLVEVFNTMLHDLSVEMIERHGAEEALRAADRRKDEFLATLAHELRNPLAPLTNALALLRRADDKPAVRRSAYAMMERQLAQMVRLIDDLMEVSRITRGKLELRVDELELVAVVQSALESAEPVLHKNGHHVHAEMPAHPLYVRGDAARLTQVFVNLLQNAARYTPAGRAVRLLVQPQGTGVAVIVQDQGIGIAAEQQRSIFDMFVQVDKSLERGAAGLGVGLTIAKQIVDLHGGAITVVSAGLGAGSTFTVVLPDAAREPRAALPPPATSDADAPDAPAVTPLDVLIADDNVDFASSLSRLLRLEGYPVRVAHDGHAALAAAQRQPPDVAFLDVGMPGINGYDLALQLHSAAATRHTLLVAVTGWGQQADRQRSRAAGFAQHLVKPIQIEQALAVLRAHVSTAQHPSSVLTPPAVTPPASTPPAAAPSPPAPPHARL